MVIAERPSSPVQDRSSVGGGRLVTVHGQEYAITLVLQDSRHELTESLVVSPASRNCRESTSVSPASGLPSYHQTGSPAACPAPARSEPPATMIPGAMLRALRDLVLPMILKRQGSADSQRWIFNHHIEWDDQVLLSRAA